MSDLINFLTSKEIIMVYVVAAIACALYFVIHYIDKLYYQRRIQRQNTKELKRLVEDINNKLALEQEENDLVEEIEEQEEIIYIEPVLEMVPETKIELNEEPFSIITNKLVSNENPVIIEEVTTNEDVSVIEDIEEQMEVFVQEVKSSEQVQIEQLSEIEVVEQLENNVVEQIEEVEEENVVEIIEEVKAVNNIEKEEISVAEETLDYTNAEPNRFEAQEELRKLTEALEQAEESTKNIDLTSYEEMQEKEAIISLEELMKRSKEMYENNELTQYADEGNEPISLEDLERKVKESLEIESIVEETTVNNEPVVIEQITMTEVMQETPEIIKSAEPKKFIMDDFYSIKEEPKKSTAYQEYKSMPVISPIYGLEKKNVSSLELENTANYDKLDEEIKKTNEFIMSLKELQENLD